MRTNGVIMKTNKLMRDERPGLPGRLKSVCERGGKSPDKAGAFAV